MPLTFSHPAIILPLNWLPKRWVSLTGLIAGSVAPDFEYFLRMRVLSLYSHTWLGLLWFDLPMGVVIAFIYHNIVRETFVRNVPAWFGRRFIQYNHFNWNIYFKQNILVIIVSVIIGVASHLFWDGFTHLNGYFVQTYYVSNKVQIFGTSIPLFKVIQHLSTLIGAIVIIAAIYKMPVQVSVNDKAVWQYWMIVFTIICFVVLLRVVFGLNIHEYWNLLVTVISGGIIAFVFTPSLFKLKA